MSTMMIKFTNMILSSKLFVNYGVYKSMTNRDSLTQLSKYKLG